jgi:hypothetical protein
MAEAAVSRGKVAAAVVLGASWPWIGAIILLCGYLTFPLITWFATFGFSLDISRVVIRVGAAVEWAFAYGLVFGVPLGLIVKNHVSRYWLVLLLAR